MQAEGCATPVPSTGATRQFADELEQATVALEDARDEAALLARAMNALAAENRALKAELAGEKARLARREAAAEEVRSKFEAAAAQSAAREAASASREAAEAATAEELGISLEELRITAEELQEANYKLACLNEELGEQVAARTAELTDANAMLRESEERLRLIFEGATDYAIFALDTGGRVSEWNAGAERLLGFEAEEVLGRRPDAVWTPEDRAAGELELEMRRAAEEGRASDDRWHLRRDGSRFWAAGVMTPLRGGAGELRGFLKVLRDCTEARVAEERRKVLAGELDHRVKNTLAVVQSVAAQTLRHADMPPAVQSALLARLGALARSHDLLNRNHWEGAPLADVVGRTLAPHVAAAGGGEERITARGPSVRLPASAVTTVNLAFHELATNAAKHGALSVPEGRVEVAWAVERKRGGGPPAVGIVWRERGGPPVRPPARRGFGSRLIEAGLAREFGAEAKLDFTPEGVECRIRIPLAATARRPKGGRPAAS